MMTEEEWKEWKQMVKDSEKRINVDMQMCRTSYIQDRLILAAYRELKSRREDEEWLKEEHLRNVCWDAESGQFEAAWYVDDGVYFRTGLTIHAAITAARGK